MDILFRYLVAMVFMFSVLFIWLMVQRLSRKFASEHPEFGPAREEGGGCGGGGKCNCGSVKNCTNPKIKHTASKKNE
ncbi:MAG: chemotaxis protein [Gammaproteobacteria bacterium]|nr:chemotaxis protein [Gammaproteobacteria bacterium]